MLKSCHLAVCNATSLPVEITVMRSAQYAHLFHFMGAHFYGCVENVHPQMGLNYFLKIHFENSISNDSIT